MWGLFGNGELIESFDTELEALEYTDYFLDEYDTEIFGYLEIGWFKPAKKQAVAH